jgi:peptidoglycan hydrolase-like protein with peptidoglycan-binding domain
MSSSSSIGSVSQTRPASASSTPSLEGLQRGSRGPDVMDLQRQLNARGAQLEVDGKFGPLTEAALKQFQGGVPGASSGRVDAATVAALQAPPKAAAPSSTSAPAPTTPKATADAQQGARARSAADECRIKAQLDKAAPAATSTTTPPATSTTTPSATSTTTPAKPEGRALTPEQVKAALTGIEAGKKQVAEEKAVLGQVKEALTREVGELAKPATKSVADQAVLAGRRGQLDAVTKAEGVLDMKTQGYDAAATAVKDGVLTADEAKSLATIDGAVKTSEAAIAQQGAAAAALVDRGIKAGGRGSPTLGLKKPEAPSTSTTAPAGQAIAKSDVDAAQARIQQAIAGTRVEQGALAGVKKTVEGEVKTLEALKDRTVADDAVLAGRKAQLEILGQATKHLDVRVAGLEAASRAIGDGVLTPDEAKNLATADSALTAAEQQLGAQASAASALIQRGLAAGGRGSSVHL